MSEFASCPYPGLRPFNEDEAIFFKGREEHIEQIVKQLEEKKFLMLTGASGDGKSSLVYAGVIPNARAGFFKAKFNNWVIADFRPERQPLKNFSDSLCRHLKIEDSTKTEKELSYGFSALIDLYKSSAYWVDQTSPGYIALSEADKKKAKRKGANLMILVDQFEEFFTNPENYSAGKASIESQTVVNLLLETTRLAIEQDIPIYIICTMRSDYIGQCAAFRGLPEYIGYSQFFVPRLKRKEIYQVIEEPALLNGNKISKRLVDMLINEMNDGIDQLPVLQHALNQIWQMADKGRVEMDIIHFAKISGVQKAQLNATDKVVFEKWFENLPDFKKEFFTEASLENVLDSHANELYENSAKAVNEKAGSEIVSPQDARLIVEAAFKCLTKIDEARAVRNRMTLEEVTKIINLSHINEELVASVLEVYRKQGNTFLKPFITEENASEQLKPDAVLDITHESLIRNWKKLIEWANQEHDSYQTYQDFYKQLKRWLDNDKSSDYLLPIGPLTFFETWYNEVKPNKYWLARYDERDLGKEEKLIQASETLKNIQLFLKRSARSLFFSRTVLKYGADRILTVFSLLLLIFSCTYFYFDFKGKENSAVVEDVKQKGLELLKSKKVDNYNKANFIIAYERQDSNSLDKLISILPDDSNRVDVLRIMFANCLRYQENNIANEPNNPLITRLFQKQLQILKGVNYSKSNTNFISNINNILTIVYSKITLKRNNITIKDDGAYKKVCFTAFEALLRLIQDTSSLKKLDGDQFNKLLQVAPELIDYDSTELVRLISKINPFEQASKKYFDVIYSKDRKVRQSFDDNTLTHNGGFYQMANLFALTKNFNELTKAFDSLTFYNKDFIKTDNGYCYNRLIYDLIITNTLNTKEGRCFLDKIENQQKSALVFPLEIVLLDKLLFDKTDIESYSIINFTEENTPSHQLQLQLERISFKQINKIAGEYINKLLNDSKLQEDERNFMASLLYKARAFSFNLKSNYEPKKIQEELKNSLFYFNKVSSKYLEGDITIGNSYDLKTVNRSKVYKFCGVVQLTNGYSIFNSYSLTEFKDKLIFMDYLINKNGFVNSFCKNNNDAEAFNEFIISYFYEYDPSNDEDKNSFKSAEKALNDNQLNSAIDKNFLLGFLSYHYDLQNFDSLAGKYASRVDFNVLLDKYKLKISNKKTEYYRMAKSLFWYFLKPRKRNYSNAKKEDPVIYKKHYDLLKTFPEQYAVRNSILMAIDSFQLRNEYLKSFILLDSFFTRHISKQSQYGIKLFEVLGRISTTACDKMALSLMKELKEYEKNESVRSFIKGKLQCGKYLQAVEFIPKHFSSASQLSSYTEILKFENIKRKKTKYDGWSSCDLNKGDYYMQDPGYENGFGNIIFF